MDKYVHKENFINDELQNSLVALGYKEPVFGSGTIILVPPTEYHHTRQHSGGILYKQALDWFIQKHKLFPIIVPTEVTTSTAKGYRFRWDLIDLDTMEMITYDKSLLGFLTTTDATEDTIIKMIEIIKERK